MADSTNLLNAAQNGNHTEVERLVAVLSSDDIERSGALRAAAMEGHVECVKLLCADGCPVTDPPALWWAATNGNLECVKELVRRFDATMEDSYALYCATRHAHIEVVEFLIPISDPFAQNSRALRRAAENGSAECLKRLIPVSDPKSNNSQALCSALVKQHIDCVELLYPVSDPKALLEELEQRACAPHAQDFDILTAYQMLKSMIEKEQLEHSINEVAPHFNNPRKI